MVKHTQTILWLLPTNCWSVFNHLVGLSLKRLTGKNCWLFLWKGSFVNVWQGTLRLFITYFTAGIYLLKVNKTISKIRCEVCSIKTSGAFIVNFEHNSNLVLMFLFLTLNMWMRLKWSSRKEAWKKFNLIFFNLLGLERYDWSDLS